MTELFEESFGLVEHIKRLKSAFRTEDDETLTDTMQVERALAEIRKDQQVMVRVLERLAHDIHFVREQSANLFNNEVVLWRDVGGTFSLRMFIYSPESDSYIHDHNAWGMFAPWFGKVLVENYERVDNGESEEKGKIIFKDKKVLAPGQAELVKPLNLGIHRVDYAEDAPAIVVAVYGRSLNRGYILRFDAETSRINKIYHRSRHRREWAKKLLDLIGA